MGVRERIRRYKTTGAAAGMARVEVLVPPESRDQILSLAQRLRDEYRREKAARSVNAERVNDRAKLMIHRMVARRMASDPGLVDRARAVLSRARTAGQPYEHIAEWEDLLAREPAELRRIICARSDNMDRLRASSPFAPVAGVEDPDLRRRIWRMARRGMAHRVA
ncbi:MAG: hypothetical protein QGI63_07100 [Rhodospirillales bacterium]|jgi:hypothetical protein|nr:hypothetical protein [Rhodospirillales bacterium]|tara:strand:- start:260 stop:754 length:495 start_codon:yes stop_codon:yes gene_type:complete